MADIIIPGINKVLLDGTIVILNGFDDVKYILHNGFYMYNSEVFEGWYGVSIPEQNVIPLAPQMLIGCEVIYYPNSNCECRFPSGNIPFTTEDEYQVQRSFITVDTMTDRDKLSPNMSITDIPNGRIVRVNKPNNLDFEPKYYVYRHNQDLTEAYWEEYNIYIIPADGIPKSDLSDDVQTSLDKADTALQKLPVYTIDWLYKNQEGQYDHDSVIHNIEVLNELANKSSEDYISYIAYRDILYPASFGISTRRKGVYVTLYDAQVEQIVQLSIYSDGTIATYAQERILAVNTDEFDKYDSWIPASQSSTANYIDAVTDPKGAAQTVQNNLDVVANTVSTLSSDVSQIKSNISDINAVIPNQASAQNQLADKDFVNSTVATNTAYFRGTYDSVAALEEYSGPLTNNDYAFVVQYDTVKPEQVVSYSRYKYNSQTGQWGYEYTLNNSSFTAEQWAAINSGMTAELVTSVRGHIANATIHVTAEDKTAWNSKYVKPTAGIPSSDMTDEVQASLQKAETALQTIPTASAETLGGIKVGENLTIDPQTGVMSAEAGVTTYILHWFDEPTQEQKDANKEIILQIKERLVAGDFNFNTELWLGTSDYDKRLTLSEYKFVPVAPPAYIGIQLSFNAPTFGRKFYNNEYVSYNFGTYYTLSVIDLPGSLGRQYSQEKYVADTQFHSATRNYKGMVQIGDGIDVDQNGVISNAYELPIATADTLGGVKIGDGINVDQTGIISVDGGSVYIIPSNATSATISDTLSNMATDYESDKPVSAYIALPSSPYKQIPAMITWQYRINPDYTKTVIAIYINGLDFRHASSYSGYTYDEIPYYYYIQCSLSGTTWSVSTYQGNYAQSTINGDEVSTNRPSQYAIVNKRAVINYVKSKAYMLPTATTSTLGGVKIGTNLAIDDNGVVSVQDDTFVAVSNYAEDMKAVDSAIQSVGSTAANAIQQHAENTEIHVTSAEKDTWNNKQNALTAGNGITIIDDIISANSISDTGWRHIDLITSSQIGALEGAWAYEAPVDSAFAYRIINGNHVYIAGGFRVISAPSFDTILSATLPDSIRPKRLVPDGSGGFNWSVGNVRFNCATATSNVNVELSIEQGANVIRWRGMSGDTKTDMVSVMFDYYVS